MPEPLYCMSQILLIYQFKGCTEFINGFMDHVTEWKLNFTRQMFQSFKEFQFMSVIKAASFI